MTLYKKFLFAFVLITSFGHIAAAPAPQEEHPEAHDDFENKSKSAAPKVPLGLRFRRMLTAWLCIPEDQLTIKSHLQNSIPWLAYTAHTQSAFKYWTDFPQDEMDWSSALGVLVTSIGCSDLLVFPTSISLQGPQKKGLIGALSTSSILKKTALNTLRGVPTDYKADQENADNIHRNSRHLNPTQRGPAMRSIGEAPHLRKEALHGLANIFEGEEIVRKCIKRKKFLVRLTKAIPLVWSRGIPVSMTNKKYIVVESSLGYLLRNASHLVRGMACITKLLHVGSEWLINKEKNLFNQANSSEWEKRVHTIVKDPLEYASSSTNYLNKIMVAVTTTLGITNTFAAPPLAPPLYQTLSLPYAAYPYVRILSQLPYAPHCYIEESEFKKLSKHDQITLYQLASEDWFDAVETINNLLHTFYKSPENDSIF